MENEKAYCEAYEKIMQIYKEQYDSRNPLFEIVGTDQHGIYHGESFKKMYNGDIIRFAEDLENSVK